LLGPAYTLLFVCAVTPGRFWATHYKDPSGTVIPSIDGPSHVERLLLVAAVAVAVWAVRGPSRSRLVSSAVLLLACAAACVRGSFTTGAMLGIDWGSATVVCLVAMVLLVRVLALASSRRNPRVA
jgi:hypothetical protein